MDEEERWKTVAHPSAAQKLPVWFTLNRGTSYAVLFYLPFFSGPPIHPTIIIFIIIIIIIIDILITIVRPNMTNPAGKALETNDLSLSLARYRRRHYR